MAITGTLINPSQFKLRFEALSALLSLFDLQEKVNSEIELTASESRGSAILPDDATDEDNIALHGVQILLENVIQDSCKYVSQSS